MSIYSIILQSVDIGYSYTIYLFLAFLLLSVTERIIGPIDVNSTIPNYLLIIELIAILWIYGIIFHFIKLLVSSIPHLVKSYTEEDSLNGSYVVFSYIFLTCSVNIQDRLYLLYNRLMGKNYPLTYSTTTRHVSK